MNKENVENVRVTRARARAMKASSTKDGGVVGLRDVTNTSTKSSHKNKRIHTSNFENEACKKRKTKVASEENVSLPALTTKENVQSELAEDSSTLTTTMKDSLQLQVPPHLVFPMLSMQASVNSPVEDINLICEKLRTSVGFGIVDIDSEAKDSPVWTSYAPDIYYNIHVKECEKRPLANYMEKVQQDITPTMRGILVDWLVEVSDEYKLVPDTLYLTVNLIDRFLSCRVITRQRLQLLGVTCMLISSKYEEISAPPLEEFVTITDNTYSKKEILKMEKEVLNVLQFQLSVPTIKTFLRRFIHAAQSSYKVAYPELEFMANYLAELALVEYSLLQYRPSKIAASAVFLARWTLGQSEHPWNPTLEHYTNYKTSELKTTVLILHDLQRNTKGCDGVREKYQQDKFKSVANFSPKPVEPLF
ncbi:cyclin-A2-2-like isoform X2 [Vicia villosa]|uniref:cyclin-A2-2-like isoform X2 n=1 Tax=Vicia villosa TaxID=3911 RepID=UPI00273B1451|nr:cyclin-A2-2-like isoform X2 [Vicia villosa]